LLALGRVLKVSSTHAFCLSRVCAVPVGKNAVALLTCMALANVTHAVAQPILVPETVANNSPQLFEIADLSGRMAAHARDNNDPLLLISAARLRAGLGPLGYSSGLGSSENWLDAATQMAPNDAMVRNAVQQTRTLLVRGRTPGPLVFQKRLVPAAPEQISIQFRPGYRATVYAEASVGQSLTLQIQHPNGTQICLDAAVKSQSICSWIADGTGRYIATVSVKTASDVLVVSN
jgi:hypothetical protein